MGISKGTIQRTLQERGTVIQSVHVGESVSAAPGTGSDEGIVCPEGGEKGKIRKIKLNKVIIMLNLDQCKPV